MTVISLFDGMSCGRIALDRLGIKVDTYYASEIDKYAMQVAKKNYPDTIHIGDVTKVSFSRRRLIDADGNKHRIRGDILLIGGSPCQGFSFAGKMKGASTKCNIEITTLEQYLKLKRDGFEFDGQSYLFWEYVRLREEINPKYFLLENVVMAKKWWSMFDNAMGVGAIKINSSLVSAQNRNRLYWTNIPNVTQPKDKGIYLKDIRERLPFRELKPFCFGYYGKDQRISKMKRIYDKKSHCLTTNKGHTLNYYLNRNKTKMRNLSAIEAERLQTVPDNYTSSVNEGARFKMLGNGWTIDVIAHIFKGML